MTNFSTWPWWAKILAGVLGIGLLFVCVSIALAATRLNGVPAQVEVTRQVPVVQTVVIQLDRPFEVTVPVVQTQIVRETVKVVETVDPVEVAKQVATMMAPTATPLPTKTPVPVFTATIAALQAQIAVSQTVVSQTTAASAATPASQQISITLVADPPAQQVITATLTAVVSAADPPLTISTTGTMPAFITTTTHGAWTVSRTERLGDNPIVVAWINRLQDPAPAKWKVFPNVPNPLVADFNVKNGAEYGVGNAPFCQQDTRCDFVVPAWHYRLVTGDYEFMGQRCDNTDKTDRHGCLLLLINVMNESFTWRNQMADNGFTVMGRYWNGDVLDMAVWGLVSNASANMLGMPTLAHPGEVLNSGAGDNAGANCGIPNACGRVEATVVIHAGDAILVVLKTTVTRP